MGNVKQTAKRGHVTIQRPDGIVSCYAYFGGYGIGRISKGTVIASRKLFFLSHNVVMTVNYIDHIKQLRKALNTIQLVSSIKPYFYFKNLSNHDQTPDPNLIYLIIICLLYLQKMFEDVETKWVQVVE